MNRSKIKVTTSHCNINGTIINHYLYIPSGVAGMGSVKACKAMLDGMTSAITDLKPSSLSLIRIVILEQPVFQAFRSEMNLTHIATNKRRESYRFSTDCIV